MGRGALPRDDARLLDVEERLVGLIRAVEMQQRLILEIVEAMKRMEAQYSQPDGR